MNEKVTLRHVNVDVAAEMLNNSDVCVVDNRDWQSYEARHIDGAIHLSNDNVQQFLEQVDRTKPILCCCYHGHSSQQVGQFLLQQGFTDVYNLDGGFEAWRQQFPDEQGHGTR